MYFTSPFAEVNLARAILFSGTLTLINRPSHSVYYPFIIFLTNINNEFLTLIIHKIINLKTLNA